MAQLRIKNIPKKKKRICGYEYDKKIECDYCYGTGKIEKEHCLVCDGSGEIYDNTEWREIFKG